MTDVMLGNLFIQYGLIVITMVISFWRVVTLKEQITDLKDNKDKLWIKYDELVARDVKIEVALSAIQKDIQYIREKLDSREK